MEITPHTMVAKVAASTMAISGEANTGKRKTADLLFLAGVVMVLQGYFVRRLGFYSDDWWILGTLTNARAQGLGAILSAAFRIDGFVVRPVQGLEFSLLYWLFGNNPLGYHVANFLTLIAGVLLFYLALVRLKLPRILVVALPLVYAMLPHYSTARFWLSSFCANISILFLFLHLYAGLRCVCAAENAGRWKWWLAISGLSVVACALAYEVAVPLFLVNFCILYRVQRKRSPLHSNSASWPGNVLLLCTGLLFAASIAYKFLLSERTGGIAGSYLMHVARILRAVLANDFWVYGAKQPVILWKIVRDYYNPRILLTGAALFAAIVYYLFNVGADAVKKSDWLKLIGAGIVVYVGGYAAFLVTSNFQVSAAGISNRITVAAAIGVAICFVGAAGLLCSFVKPKTLRSTVFSLVLAAVACSGYIINCTISNFFAQSYAQQLAVLDKIYAIAPGLGKNSTILLDGQCPYVGPAPVFDCHWDLSGALTMHYNADVKADVRTRRMTYNASGISTYVYTIPSRLYPYSPQLLVYNAEKNKLYSLPDFKSATQYFSLVAPKLEPCANVLEGEGIRIF
ncbi:hypothetical protein MUN81_19270 [Hymenobacter sp. 5317J-9]|uniref:hypothetical protein n=1 Tax=Hymenobacter sp. 5317J-9 TaxID=2932250 RepID=UPI001FD6438A|nr:hypothetical protein [Hymenobacter sp. 5317J-9]UOQ97364.1 hypothetical protein MUN81_19270 [Hymenobacter sp. 5317J-9]